MERKGNKRKKRHIPNNVEPCCDTCTNAQYLGEGDVCCMVYKALVRDGWEVTDDFLKCLGKDYRRA